MSAWCLLLINLQGILLLLTCHWWELLTFWTLMYNFYPYILAAVSIENIFWCLSSPPCFSFLSFHAIMKYKNFVWIFFHQFIHFRKAEQTLHLFCLRHKIELPCCILDIIFFFITYKAYLFLQLYVHGEKFNQPIFHCNNISGLVEPVSRRIQFKCFVLWKHSFRLFYIHNHACICR